MKTLMNSVRLCGHLGNDPEIKTFENNRKMARFSLATNEVYKNEKGEKITETTWHNVVAWGTLCGNVEKLLRKGAEISLEGRISNRSYTDKDGTKKYYSEVVMNEMMLHSKRDE